MKQPDNYFVEVDSRHFCIKPARDASRGFTLIELVVVIALIAILAAVALPRMLDTYDNAHEAAVFGVGGAMASAMILVRSQWVANGGRLQPQCGAGQPGTMCPFMARRAGGECALGFEQFRQRRRLPGGYRQWQLPFYLPT